MSQLRLDPLTGRWIVISSDRADRPAPFAPRLASAQEDPTSCPFCPGNEVATPPALETYGPGGAWRVRVVPNLYPAFSGTEPMAVHNAGPVFLQAPASGIHEVVVFSPNHDLNWADFDDEQAELLMSAVRDRIEEHAAVAGIRYSQFITNSGREAGASLDHPHGQLLGIPFVPAELLAEQAGFSRFAGACLLCTLLDAEEEANHRIVAGDAHTITICPYWSGTPYEMLVLPRRHEPFAHRAEPEDVASVARAVRDALARLRRTVGNVAYNVVLHYSPFRATADFHWHVHLLPKVTTLAGFELGTGVFINIVPPEFAAAELRAAVAASG